MLDKISVFNKCRKDFFCEVIILLLSIKGRINFLQIGRFGNFSEQRYRQQYEKPFPWLDFNKELTLSQGGNRFVIAFEPSCISKSGKKTPGLGWYWSGCAGKAKWGLENCSISRYLVAYAWFSKKLYFCTDTQMDALAILDCYQSRFQIEFLYRDGKQYAGLNDSQARSENKLNFQFNTALTAINIAKVEHWLCTSKEERKSFSMAEIKTMNHNRLLLQRFIDVFGVNAYSAKKRNHVNEFIYYGTIAA